MARNKQVTEKRLELIQPKQHTKVGTQTVTAQKEKHVCSPYAIGRDPKQSSSRSPNQSSPLVTLNSITEILCNTAQKVLPRQRHRLPGRLLPDLDKCLHQRPNQHKITKIANPAAPWPPPENTIRKETTELHSQQLRGLPVVAHAGTLSSQIGPDQG